VLVRQGDAERFGGHAAGHGLDVQLELLERSVKMAKTHDWNTHVHCSQAAHLSFYQKAVP
jgi:hypothetical protein